MNKKRNIRILCLLMGVLLCSCSSLKRDTESTSIRNTESTPMLNTDSIPALNTESFTVLPAADPVKTDLVWYTPDGAEYLRIEGGGDVLDVTPEKVIFSRSSENGLAFFVQNLSTNEVNCLGEIPEQLQFSGFACPAGNHVYLLYYLEDAAGRGDRVIDLDLQKNALKLLYQDRTGGWGDVLTCIDGQTLLLAKNGIGLIKIHMDCGGGTLIRKYDFFENGETLSFISEGDDQTAAAFYFRIDNGKAVKALLDIFDPEMELVETVDVSSILDRCDTIRKDPSNAVQQYRNVIWKNTYFYCSNTAAFEFLGTYNGKTVEKYLDFAGMTQFCGVRQPTGSNGYLYFSTLPLNQSEKEQVLFRMSPESGTLEAAVLPAAEQGYELTEVSRYSNGCFSLIFTKDQEGESQQNYTVAVLENELQFKAVDLEKTYRLENAVREMQNM